MDDAQSVDFKFVDNYLKDKFLRPFARRLKYIYFGLEHDKNTFVLSDTEDTDFKYCEAMQTTGLIKITNEEHLSKILSWFDYCKIDRNNPCIFYLNRISALLNKMKWDDPEIKFNRDFFGIVTMSTQTHESIIIARPIDTHFTLTKLQGFLIKYTKAFFEDSEVYYDVEMGIEKVNSVSDISISCDNLYTVGLLDKRCNDIKLILLIGLDLLVAKSLIVKDKDYEFGMRLWADNGKRCINYGSFYRDIDISICTSRDNIFIFPITKKE